MPTNPELVALVDDVLVTTLSVVRDLAERDGDLPTDCPGWTVRDHLAHMVGLEQVLDGAPEPDVELPPLDHVESEIDAYMERHVHVRRGLPLVAVADELAGMLPRRIAALERLAALDDPLVRVPFGERPLSTALPTRVLDLWMHEQDIRSAVGLPLRTTGGAADLALERALAVWPRVLPERCPELDGEVRIDVADRPGTSVVVTFGTGAGGAAELTGGVGDIVRWFGGRAVPSDGECAGDVGIAVPVRSRLACTP